MPQSPHDRAAEYHNKAAHAHQAAATAHGKGDHLTAHELSKQAHEYSTKAFEHSREAAAKSNPGSNRFRTALASTLDSCFEFLTMISMPRFIARCCGLALRRPCGSVCAAVC